MIEARNLVKSYNGRAVLENVGLKVDDQKTIVILGPSGQGKTVLVKILARLIEPDGGAVYYDGLDIFRLAKKDFKEIRKTTAFVFQANALFDFLNVRDNLSLSIKMHSRLSGKEIEERVMESIRFVGLDPTVLGKFPEELSEGMSKRVAIARAMIIRPRVVFYDEPTSGLDKGNVAKVMELISLLKTEVSATSVVVTHDIELMNKVADSVILLRRGKVTFSGNKQQVSKAMLTELYGPGEDNGG